MATYDAIVVGGGLVGAAIAYGLAKQGLSTLVLDEGDVAHRASRGNFGLVWVQSKGAGAPHYHRWSRASASEWPALAAELVERTGQETGLRQPGGLYFALSDAELDARAAMIAGMQRDAGNFGLEYRVLDHAEVKDLVPSVGPGVVGAVWTPYDGHANPLYLLRGLHDALLQRGGAYRPNVTVTRIAAAPHDFAVEAGGERFRAPRLVLAAGLGNAELAPLVGLSAPMRPERGQVLVTERTKPLMDMPSQSMRQTAEGSMMMGDSKEDAGFDTLTQSPPIMRAMAARAVQCIPAIKDLNIVRAWSALRVMSPDGQPVYDQSVRYPGAFTANCHSGVTLAGAHARLLAPMIVEGALAPELARFTGARFDVQAAA